MTNLEGAVERLRRDIASGRLSEAQEADIRRVLDGYEERIAAVEADRERLTTLVDDIRAGIRCALCRHFKDTHLEPCGMPLPFKGRACRCEKFVTEAMIIADAERRWTRRGAQYGLRAAHEWGDHRTRKVPVCEACQVEVKIALHEWSSRYFPAVGIPRALR